MRLLVIAVLVAGCKGDSKPKLSFVRYIVDHIPPALAKRTSLEISGVRSLAENGFVDVPKDKLPPAGASINVHYETPCGAKSISFPLPATPPNENGVVMVDFPAGHELPTLTNVFLDPKLAEPVQIGTKTLDPKSLGPNAPTKLFDVRCAASIKVGANEVPLPAKDAPKNLSGAPDRSYGNVTLFADDALFVTARADQCFSDRQIAYGNEGQSRSTELRGARAYWLGDVLYSYWFEPVPDTVEVRAGESASRSALVECP